MNERGNDEAVSVGVADDHLIARLGLERVFAGRPDIVVTVSAASLDELRELAGERLPDVLVLDLYLDGKVPSLTAIGELAARRPVLIVSASSARRDVLAALRAGAMGYVTKEATAEVFTEAVMAVRDGGFYLSAHLADLLHAHRETPQGPVLSAREEEALRFVAEGYTQAQAARRMGVSPWTLDTYLRRVRQKFGIGNKAELTRLALGGDRTPPPV